MTENEVYTALWQVRARPISGDALPTPTCQPWHPRRHPLHLALASAFTVIAPLLLLPSAGPALTDCLDGHAYVQHNDDEDRAVQALFGTASLADTRGKRTATEEVLPDGKPNAFKRLRDAQRAFGESPTANPEGPATVVENVYPGTKKEQQDDLDLMRRAVGEKGEILDAVHHGGLLMRKRWFATNLRGHTSIKKVTGEAWGRNRDFGAQKCKEIIDILSNVSSLPEDFKLRTLWQSAGGAPRANADCSAR